MAKQIDNKNYQTTNQNDLKLNLINVGSNNHNYSSVLTANSMNIIRNG